MKISKPGLVSLFAVAVSLALFAAISPAQADDARDDPLMKFVPAGADLIVGIDLERILSMQIGAEAKGIIEDDPRDLGEYLDLLEKYDLDLKDVCRRIVFFLETDAEDIDNPIFGFIVRTSVGEAALREMLEAEADEYHYVFRTRRIGGREAILLSEQADDMLPPDIPQPAQDVSALIYLDIEHVLITAEDVAEGILGRIIAGRTLTAEPLEGMAKISRDSIFWGLHEGTGNYIKEYIFEEGPFTDIKSAVFSLSLVGTEGPDMRFNLAVETAAQESSQGIFALAQQYYGMLPMIFEDNPELGRIIVDAISVERKPGDREVEFNVSVGEEQREWARKAIAEVRREALIARSSNNLWQIGSAIGAYRARNEGRHPASLAELHDRWIWDLNVFQSPFDPRKEPIREAVEVEDKISYIYNPNVKGKHITEIPQPHAQTPMVIERPEHFDGEGALVLFVDITLRYVEGDELARVLEQMRAQ